VKGLHNCVDKGIAVQGLEELLMWYVTKAAQEEMKKNPGYSSDHLFTMD